MNNLLRYLVGAGSAFVGFLLLLLGLKSRQVNKLKVQVLDEKFKGADGVVDERLRQAEEERKKAEAEYEKLLSNNSDGNPTV